MLHGGALTMHFWRSAWLAGGREPGISLRMSLMPPLPLLLALPCVMFHMVQLYYCLPCAMADLRKSQSLVLCGGLISTKQGLLMRPGGLRA